MKMFLGSAVMAAALAVSSVAPATALEGFRDRLGKITERQSRAPVQSVALQRDTNGGISSQRAMRQRPLGELRSAFRELRQAIRSGDQDAVRDALRRISDILTGGVVSPNA
ncbi:hypothetical protein FHS85_003290 [Rhodoligotrophos appendicifer]|uniref:hypothetical protein n=1 Tax=Rhodoligotrophos appendicifer TaxID=987056 RepID=UPI00118589F2|nr:hypothetical protein [Rhodoligotrophos appendicifer]